MGNECKYDAHTSKLDKYTVLDTVFKLEWQKSKDKDDMVVKVISVFQTAVHFCETCQALLSEPCFKKHGWSYPG